MTTGALAVQESLQFDRMINPTPQRQEHTVSMKDIKPVQVKSHPFDEMRGDKEPVFSDLARLTPVDNYYIRFNTLNKLRELLDFANDWGPSLLRLAEPVGADYDLDARIRRPALSARFGAFAVAGTGGDQGTGHHRVRPVHS